MRWYHQAADKGHAQAMLNLGYCYKYGTGVAKDEAGKVRGYRHAADKGHAGAMYTGVPMMDTGVVHGGAQ